MPTARITLIGEPAAGAFVERFQNYVDELLVFPGLDGQALQLSDAAALPAFYAEAAARRFDVALQLHDSGPASNTIVSRLGASYWAGFIQAAGMSPSSEAPVTTSQRNALLIPWPRHLPEVLRHKTLLQQLGITVESTELESPLTPVDCDAATNLFTASGLNPRQTVMLYPGARIASKHWPISRFVHVAGELSRRGWQIVVTGDRSDLPLAQQLTQALTCFAINLAGQTSAPTLAALMAMCRLVICNDPGISHMAAAVQTPSIVVASGDDVNRWTPLNRDLHTILSAPANPLADFFKGQDPTMIHPASGVQAEDVLVHALHKLAMPHAHA